MTEFKRTELHGFHAGQGARFAPFAGYEMPIQYTDGALAEHRHTREAAGLFDVSHMGQIAVMPSNGDMSDAARVLETLLPLEIESMPVGRQKYGLLTNAKCGIRDDLIIARKEDHFMLVVNAANKSADLAYIRESIATSCQVDMIEDRGIIALQGRKAETCLRSVLPGLPGLSFMDVCDLDTEFGQLWIARAGYTGGDGFEISVASGEISGLAQTLVDATDARPAGLAARDTLRLEAGLCLHGSDIDETTTIIEADLAWAVNKSRRPGGPKAGGYPGADVFAAERDSGAARKRVGLGTDSRSILRSGYSLFSDEACTDNVGVVTSGGFGPSVNHPVAMGYVDRLHAGPGGGIYCMVRRKPVQVTVTGAGFLQSSFVK